MKLPSWGCSILCFVFPPWLQSHVILHPHQNGHILLPNDPTWPKPTICKFLHFLPSSLSLSSSPVRSFHFSLCPTVNPLSVHYYALSPHSSMSLDLAKKKNTIDCTPRNPRHFASSLASYVKVHFIGRKIYFCGLFNKTHLNTQNTAMILTIYRIHQRSNWTSVASSRINTPKRGICCKRGSEFPRIN